MSERCVCVQPQPRKHIGSMGAATWCAGCGLPLQPIAVKVKFDAPDHVVRIPVDPYLPSMKDE